MGDKHTDYKRQFNADNYDRLYLTVIKGHKSKLKAIAVAQINADKPKGESLNEFIIKAIDERIERLKGDEKG